VSFLVDTDICSAHLKNVGIVTNRFLQYTGRLHISAITLGELYTWALRAKASPRRMQSLLELLNDVTVLPVDDDVARKFGEVHAGLLDAGRTSPGLDLMIASTALVHGLTLVTHNTQDFALVPGLTVLDWLVP
jgi:predicted nucleic acid-binding protein